MSDTAIASPVAGSDTDTRWTLEVEPQGLVHEFPSCDSSTPDIARLRQLAAQLPSAAGEKRDALRSSIIRAISTPLFADPPSARIGAVLAGLLASKQPGRLDEAVEVLSQAGPELERFAIDAAQLNPPDQADPDFWFILIQALAKATAHKELPFLVDWALRSGKRHLIEAGILALAERTDAESRNRLKGLAQHESAFIRELVSEVLEDCTE
jgi:hypothetical protein